LANPGVNPEPNLGCIRLALHPIRFLGGNVKYGDAMRVLLFPIITSLVCMIASAETDLAGFKWKNRVLVVLAPSENDIQLKEQRAIDTAAAAGFSERDLIEVAEIGAEGPLHRRFGIKVGDFQVLLIGKDGHCAQQWPKPVSSEVLYSAIDSMPMRREEMRRQKKG
jgi:uncharacterized protein DUF4174